MTQQAASEMFSGWASIVEDLCASEDVGQRTSTDLSSTQTAPRARFFEANRSLKDQFGRCFTDDAAAWRQWLRVVRADGGKWALEELENNPWMFGTRRSVLTVHCGRVDSDFTNCDRLLLQAICWVHAYQALQNAQHDSRKDALDRVQIDFGEFAKSRGWRAKR